MGKICVFLLEREVKDDHGKKGGTQAVVLTV